MDERIPDAELEVLAAVQRRGQATGREVGEDLEGWRPLSHSSVMTLLGRLEDRGLVTRKRGEGREYVYSATATREEAVAPILRRLMNRIFDGDAASLMASLFETRRPTADQVARLETLLDELRAAGADTDSESDPDADAGPGS